jgi:hypothetical protein
VQFVRVQDQVEHEHSIFVCIMALSLQIYINTTKRDTIGHNIAVCIQEGTGMLLRGSPP